MPPLFAAPIGLALFGTAITVGDVVFAVMVGTGIGMSVYQREKLKAEQRKARRDADKLKGFQQMEPATDTPRRRIYGRARVSGPPVYANVSSDKRNLDLVVPFNWGPVDGVEQVFIDGKPVSIDANGHFTDVAGSPKSQQFAVDSFGVLNGSWTITIDGHTYYAIINVPGGPYAPQAVAAFIAAIRADPAYATARFVISDAYTAADQIQFQIAITPAAAGYYSGFTLTEKTPGTPFQVTGVTSPGSAVVAGPVVLDPVGTFGPWAGQIDWRLARPGGTGRDGGSAMTALTVLSGGQWTAAHLLQGNAYFWARLNWNETTGFSSTGPPNIELLVRGTRVHDPRDPAYPDDTPRWLTDGLAGTPDPGENPALILLDMLKTPVEEGGLGLDDTRIDLDSFAAAANICDEQVFSHFSKGSAGSRVTEPRYRYDWPQEISGTLRERIQGVLDSMDGRLYPSGGLYILKAGAWTASEATFDETTLREPPSLQQSTGVRERINAVRGTFTDPRDRASRGSYQTADFLPLKVDSYVTEDGGVELWQECDFPMVTSQSQARRLAKIKLERARRPEIIVWPAKLTQLNRRCGDIVTLDYPRWTGSLSTVTFEIIESHYVESPEENGTGIDFTLRAVDADIWSWTDRSGTDWQFAEPAPLTNLPRFSDVSAPGAPVAQSRVVWAGDSQPLSAAAEVSWEPSPDAWVTGYELEWRYTGTARWGVPLLVRGAATTIELPPGTYDLRVRAMNPAGAFSAWAESDGVSLMGLLEPPATPSGFDVSVKIGMAFFSWDATDELDVIHGGHYEIRFQPVTSGASWDEAVPLIDNIPGASSSATWILPDTAGTYLLKAYDSSGNVSESAAFSVLAVPEYYAYSAVGGPYDQDPGWDGAKAFCYNDGGTLKLGGGSDIDSWGPVDDIVMIDTGDGASGQATYTFDFSGDDYVDLGAVYTVHVTGALTYTREDISSLIDGLTAGIDSWPDMDGLLEQGTGRAWLEVRTTQDDPAGSPAWSGWGAVSAGDLRLRGIQARIVLESDSPDHQIYVTAASITLTSFAL